MAAKTKDPMIVSLNEAIDSAKWKLENYKKTFGKFPGSYAKIHTVMKLASNSDEVERELEDDLLGWLGGDIKATKAGLEFEVDVGPHIRRFKYSAKHKKWTSEKVPFFDDEAVEDLDEDEYDGLI